MKTVTKLKHAIAAKPEKEENNPVEAFFIDREAERMWAKESTHILEKLNHLCYIWQSVTKKPVKSEEEFHAILEDPATYWRSEKFQENVEQKRERTLSFIDEGYEEVEIQKMLKLPQDFKLVIDSVEVVKRLNINWKNFVWVENTFQLSQYYFNRVDGKVYYHAVTDLQKNRLAKAQALLEAIKGLEEVMVEEALEAGINPAHIEKAKKDLRYVGPLPYALRYKSAMTGEEIIVNEKWVTNGLKQWAEGIGLARIALKAQYVPKPQAPTVYLKFLRTDLDGARRQYLVPKSCKEKAYFGMWREAEVTFMPGEFIMDPVSGKLVPNE